MARPFVGGVGIRAALLGLALVIAIVALILGSFSALAVSVILAIIAEFTGARFD